MRVGAMSAMPNVSHGSASGCEWCDAEWLKTAYTRHAGNGM